MDHDFIAQLKDFLPPDLIYSLVFAGIINKNAFLSLTFADDCENTGSKIRMTDIISFIRSSLPDYWPPSELRRYTPICVRTLPDSCLLENIKNWSVSPGYRYLIESLQQDLQSSELEPLDEPSVKRRRISESMMFDISAQDVSMQEVLKERTSTPREIKTSLKSTPIEPWTWMAVEPQKSTPIQPQIPTPSEPQISTPSEPQISKPIQPQLSKPIEPQISTPNKPQISTLIEPQISIEPQIEPQISTPIEPQLSTPNKPQISTPTPQTTREMISSSASVSQVAEAFSNDTRAPQSLNAAGAGSGESTGRKRRRRKRSRKRVENDQDAKRPVIQTISPWSDGRVADRSRNGCAVGSHVIFNSDGDVEEDRDVEVQQKTLEVAQKRKVAKQKPNFSTPSLKLETPKQQDRRVSFPEMSKSAQLNSRQTNSSHFFKQHEEETPKTPSIPASQLKRRRRVQKVDIDSTSSSSSSSSSSDSEAERPAEKAPIEPSLTERVADANGGTAGAPARIYDDFPAVRRPPEPGSLICFRVLELNTLTLTPDISDYKEGILRSYEPHRDRCVIEVVANKRRCEGGGKFDVYIETEEGVLTNYEEEESTLITAWSALQDPRLIKSSGDNS